MKSILVRSIYVFLLSFFSFSAYAIDGSDIRIMVLQDDSDDDANCVSYRNAAGKQAAQKIGEQFNRYGYTVVPRESLAAELRFDLNSPLDKAQLISLAKKAKSSGRAEFDVQALVIYKILCDANSDSVATTVDADISGSVYDTESRRELGDFGPIEKSFAMPPKCDARCITMELRKHTSDMAIIVADQARNKLAMITKQAKQDGSSNRINIFNVRLENMSKMSTRIRSIMEKEFPGSKGITSLSGSGNLIKFGYRSTASSDKIRDWLEIVIEDLGLENISLSLDGNLFTIRNDGPDNPPPKKITERIFQ
jgi:hypothetical protein